VTSAVGHPPVAGRLRGFQGVATLLNDAKGRQATWIGGLVEFRLLGPLEVVDGGQPVPIPSAKHRALLAYLLVRPGELVTVDELAEVIWGDALPANPRTAVQTYVSRLRQRLHLEEVLQSRPDGYVLAVDRGDIDVGRFEILLERASQAGRAGDRQVDTALLRQALALWGGGPPPQPRRGLAPAASRSDGHRHRQGPRRSRTPQDGSGSVRYRRGACVAARHTSGRPCGDRPARRHPRSPQPTRPA